MASTSAQLCSSGELGRSSFTKLAQPQAEDQVFPQITAVWAEQGERWRVTTADQSAFYPQSRCWWWKIATDWLNFHHVFLTRVDEVHLNSHWVRKDIVDIMDTMDTMDTCPS